ncbi:NME NM23 member 5 [Chytridiales sp. JEL 0842]|nr:NME NM23 member 5 [Chytridiales sp. JEL 0842]
MNVSEKAVVVIKPEAQKHEADILYRLKQDGFTILQKEQLTISNEQALEYYEIDSHRVTDTEKAIEHITSGQSTVVLVTRNDCVEQLKGLLGPTDISHARKIFPTSLRAIYAVDNFYNGIDTSDSPSSAQRDIKLFFREHLTEPTPSLEASKLFLEDALYPVLTQGLTQLCKVKPENPTAWLGRWLLENNPAVPKIQE